MDIEIEAQDVAQDLLDISCCGMKIIVPKHCPMELRVGTKNLAIHDAREHLFGLQGMSTARSEQVGMLAEDSFIDDIAVLVVEMEPHSNGPRMIFGRVIHTSFLKLDITDDSSIVIEHSVSTSCHKLLSWDYFARTCRSRRPLMRRSGA